MKKILTAFLLLCTILSLPAFPPGFRVDSSGCIRIGNAGPFALMVYQKGWNPSFQKENSIVPEMGYPIVSEKHQELKGRWKLRYGKEFFLTEVVNEINANTVELQMNLFSGERTGVHSLALDGMLPPNEFGGKECVVNGETIPLPKNPRDFKARRWDKVTRMEFTARGHRLILEGVFQATLGESYNKYRLRIFPKLVVNNNAEQAELKLKISYVPFGTTPVDLASACNRAGKGDVSLERMRGDRNGIFRCGGLTFKLRNPAADKAFLAVKEGKSISVKAAAAKGKQLYLLHTLGNPVRKGTAGILHVTFRDGSTQKIPVVNGKDVGNASGFRRYANAAVVWDNPSKDQGVYLSHFELKRDDPETITFVSADNGEWIVCAVSLGETAVETAWLDSLTVIRPGKDYVALKSGMPDTKPGSVLDFSFLNGNDAPAGKYGRITVDQNGHFTAGGKRFRFIGTNLCFDAQFLEKAEAEKLASELAAMGYNSVRFHHFDHTISDLKAAKSTVQSASQFDKLDYLFYCMKQRGIYVTIDLFVSRNLRPGEMPGFPEFKGRELRPLAPVYQPARDNWKEYARNLLTHKNPYTGLTWAEDPALFGLSLINENTIYRIYAGNPKIEALYNAAYEEYLKKNNCHTKENATSRGTLFLKFLCGLHIDMIRDFTRFLREEIGYRGLVTDANFGDNVIQAPIRNELDFVDSHHYGDHPRNWRLFHQGSSTESSALVPRLLFPDRIFGKPFTVTEINYTFPNRWRAESAPLLGSYAALQDWDALYRFAWGHSRNAVLKKEAIIRFDTIQDPIARFAEKIIVLMFRRGDVSSATTALAYPFGERDFEGIAKYDKNTSKFPSAFEKLGFYCRVGALPAEKKLPGILTLPQGNWRSGIPDPIRKQLAINTDTRPVTSENGEITLDACHSAMRTVTPRTECLMLKSGDSSGRVMRISGADTFMVVSASAMDGKNLADSGKILLFHLTNALNNKMRFANETMTEVLSWGNPNDLLLKRGKCTVQLHLNGPEREVVALHFDGTEKQILPSVTNKGVLEFTADTAAGVMAYLIRPAKQGRTLPLSTTFEPDSYLNDNMVLQRDTPIFIAGTQGEPGKIVQVAFAGSEYRALVDPAGNWKAVLPAQKAGGPYELLISGKEKKVIYRNILCGDVWLCAGQSNMEYGMYKVANSKNEVAQAKYPEIRLAKVPTERSSDTVFTQLADRLVWQECSPKSVLRFSAVGYLFGRELRKHLNIPIGLVQACASGTRIETWMDPHLADTMSDAEKKRFRSFTEQEKIYAERVAKYRTWIRPILEQNREKTAAAAGWSRMDLDTADWRPIKVPGNWKNSAFKNFDGVLWYRRKLDINKDFLGKEMVLSLGNVDSLDTVWFNGVKVGETTVETPLHWAKQRQYRIPADLIREKDNVIAIRVMNYGGRGGLVAQRGKLCMFPADNPRKAFNIWNGAWKAKKEFAFPANALRHKPDLSILLGGPHNTGGLYNTMIAPLTSMPLKGVIWYQGEGNLTNTWGYDALFRILITSWRTAWNNPEMPFLFVQLPNWGGHRDPQVMNDQVFASENPTPRGLWPAMRQMQSSALSLPHTGMAVTIDIGEGHDIHPRNKQDVAKRLALQARKVAYGETALVADGPCIRSLEKMKGKVRVRFKNSGSGLVAKNGKLRWFVLAGKDRKYVFANAEIAGRDSVILSSPQVPDPVFAAYAWANCPHGCNLYNGEGLPAAPFLEKIP